MPTLSLFIPVLHLELHSVISQSFLCAWIPRGQSHLHFLGHSALNSWSCRGFSTAVLNTRNHCENVVAVSHQKSPLLSACRSKYDEILVHHKHPLPRDRHAVMQAFCCPELKRSCREKEVQFHSGMRTGAAFKCSNLAKEKWIPQSLA